MHSVYAEQCGGRDPHKANLCYHRVMAGGGGAHRQHRQQLKRVRISMLLATHSLSGTWDQAARTRCENAELCS